MTTTMSEPAAKPVPTTPRDYAFPHFERKTLNNGIHLVVATVTKLPLVSVLALIDAGATAEPEGKYGVASLTARLLLEGAAGLDGAALTDRFERIGTSIAAHADWDTTEISVTTLPKHLEEALGLVRDLLRAPTFPEREVHRLKEERLAELLQQLAEPRGLADEEFARAVYSASSRYAHPEGGSTESVSALTRSDAQNFYDARYRPSAITLIFAGDVSMQSAESLTTKLFSDWTGAAIQSKSAQVATAENNRLARVVAKADAPQSELRVGHSGLKRNIPDYFDTMVMNAVLGGLFSSRINLNLREVHGYTYGASSMFDWRRDAGPFVVSTAVKSEVTGDALSEILMEIDKMRAEPITESELTLATSYLDGVFPIRYETTSAIADALAMLVIHDLAPDFYDTYRANVRAVTTEGVHRAAQKHLHPDNLRVLVVGNPAVIAAPIEKAMTIMPEIVTAEGVA